MALRYIFNPMKEKFLYETLPHRLKYFAEKTPNKTAFVFYSTALEWTTLSFQELYYRSLTFAKGLRVLGISPDDIVALLDSRCPEWLTCYFGIIMAGAIVLGMRFSSKEEVKYTVKMSVYNVMIIFSSGHNGLNENIIKTFVSKTNFSGEIVLLRT